MTSIIDISLVSSVFPTDWNTAEIIPIENNTKEGEHEIANNNKHISNITGSFTEICERVFIINSCLIYYRKSS